MRSGNLLAGKKAEHERAAAERALSESNLISSQSVIRKAVVANSKSQLFRLAVQSGEVAANEDGLKLDGEGAW